MLYPNVPDHAGGARDSTMCEDIAAASRASDGYDLRLPPEDDPSCHAVDSRPADGVRSYVSIMIHGGLAKGQWAIPSSRMWPREPTHSFSWLLVTRSAQQTDLCLRWWYFPPPPTPRRRSDDWRARRRARPPPSPSAAAGGGRRGKEGLFRIGRSSRPVSLPPTRGRR